jgi:hypothetical protein
MFENDDFGSQLRTSENCHFGFQLNNFLPLNDNDPNPKGGRLGSLEDAFLNIWGQNLRN